MRTTRSSSKKAVKAKLSGFAIVDEGDAKNQKIVFNEDADVTESHQEPTSTVEKSIETAKTESDTEDDVVEEVKGSTAREFTQKIRDEERKMAKETIVKKRRAKKKDANPANASDDGDSDTEENVLTDDFFKMVDSERADKLHLSKQEKKQKKKQVLRGKHTTFIVEDEHNLNTAPKRFGQNIEVITLGTGQTENDDQDEEDRRNLLSATLGSTSKASSLFARGNLDKGGSRKRSCDSRKRGSADDESWKRSKQMVFQSRPGRAAVLFAKTK